MCSDNTMDSLASLAREDKRKLKELGIESPDISKCFPVSLGKTTFFCKSKERVIKKRKELGIYEGNDETTGEIPDICNKQNT